LSDQQPSAPSENTKDGDKRRATYLLEYPKVCITLAEKKAYTSKFEAATDRGYYIYQTEIDIAYQLGTIINTEFHQCRFFIPEKKDQQLSKLTFRNCKFKNCFLGTTTYDEIKFDKCTFESTDFMHARFLNSTFDNCSFFACTAHNSYFQNTEIDSLLFLNSLKKTKKSLREKKEAPQYIQEEIRRLKRSNWIFHGIRYHSSTR
jgi:uncharacterized protein YjbI with pentapeptide repeats